MLALLRQGKEQLAEVGLYFVSYPCMLIFNYMEIEEGDYQAYHNDHNGNCDVGTWFRQQPEEKRQKLYLKSLAGVEKDYVHYLNDEWHNCRSISKIMCSNNS